MADACPALVRDRCMEFATKLDREQPTVVVVARDERGADVPDARILVDGAVAREARGTAIGLDPGDHVLRAEAAGRKPIEERIMVRVREKDRRVEIVLARALSPESPRRTPPPERPTTLAWTLAVTSGVALVAAGGMSVAGWAMRSNLESSCKPNCSEGKVAPIKALWIGSFVALGIAVASGVAAAVLLTSGGRPERTGAITPSGLSF
jgi:hypothetical protein